MNRRSTWMLGGAGVLASLLLISGFADLSGPIALDDVDDILRDHETRIVALEGGVTTTTAPPTTTTEPPPTTTTTPPTTTTTPPPPPPPTGQRFDIILVADGVELWTAPYFRNLPYTSGVGWVDGDRVGYGCAYMFLQRDGVNVGRVTFQLTHRDVSSYGLVNDKFMVEGVRYFDGRLSDGTRRQLNDCPSVAVDYQPNTDPDYRPLIWFVEGDDALENRSYTNTTGEAIDLGRLKFQEVERITEPFTVDSPNSEPHTVYERVTVLAHFDRGDGQGFFPTIVVYYDSLVDTVSLVEVP